MTGFSDSAMEVSSAGDGVRTEAIAAGDHQPGRKPAERPAFSPARAGPATMPVKLPLFCLVACVRMRYFACAHQPTLTGSVMCLEPFVSDSLAPASSKEVGARITGSD